VTAEKRGSFLKIGYRRGDLCNKSNDVLARGGFWKEGREESTTKGTKSKKEK